MARVRVPQNSFQFGEISPSLTSRTDSPVYTNAAEKVRNFFIKGEGGVKKTAEEFQKEFLGEVPINPEVGKCGDEGKPIVESNPNHEVSKIFLNLAEKIKTSYSV